MSRLRLTTEEKVNGLSSITFDNGLLRVQVLPDAGAKIWQITYLPLGLELLWNNPTLPPDRHQPGALYDDVWSGGWDELFPNDEEARIGGTLYPDHGELWNSAWSAESFLREDETGVTLRLKTPISNVLMEKTLTLGKASMQLRFSHRLTNLGSVSFPFLWKLHPAFRVTPQHRIDLPRARMVREPAFPGTLSNAPLAFSWPHVPLSDREVDLRRISDPSEKELYFLYGTEMSDGWCALTDTGSHLACGLQFDPDVFSSCWLFASYGGWQDYNVAVLEPCTGYPLSFAAMQAEGRARVLQPGESLSTEVLFTVQQGMDAVSGFREDGTLKHDEVSRPATALAMAHAMDPAELP